MRRNSSGLVALALALAVVLSLAPAALAVGPRPVTAGEPGDRAPDPLHPAASGSAGTASATAGAAATIVRNETDTTNYLSIRDDAVERQRFGNSSLDVGSALAADARRLQEQQRQLSFERAFEQAPGRTARVALVRNETAHIEAHIETLEQRQRQALIAFNDGDIDARQLLRRLVAVDSEARQVQTHLQTVKDVAVETAGFRIPNDLGTRIDNVHAELVPVRGNVRAHVGRVMAGEHDATSVYVLTSAEGFVLAINDDRTFVREAYLADRRRPGAPDEFAGGDLRRIGVANQRAVELYPWIYSFPGPPSINSPGNSSVYNVSDMHPHGKLIAYLDGATDDVFREIQVKRLNALPTRNLTVTNGTLRLQVNRTHATGPMRLSLTQADTGSPVDGEVRVNGQTVGTTGRDGTLWTVTPHEGVRIEARTATGEVVHIRFFAQ